MRIKDWFRPKRIIAAAVIAGALLVTAGNINKAIKEHKELQKNPIVQLSTSNYDTFIMMIDNARTSLNHNDHIGILESYDEFKKKKPQFEDSLFTKKYLDNLENIGAITAGERQIINNMKLQFGELFVQLGFEAEQILKTQKI